MDQREGKGERCWGWMIFIRALGYVNRETRGAGQGQTVLMFGGLHDERTDNRFGNGLSHAWAAPRAIPRID